MNIIIHHPLPLDINAKSASGIRPLRMLSAFQSLGYDVDLVTGYAVERKACVDIIKEKVRRGKQYDFVYSESSTMPTALTDPHHLPLHPFLDWSFFKFCNKKRIPVGLFYRDIYWLFDDYAAGLHPVKAAVAKAAYRFDLWIYRQTLTKLYLPSLEMGQYVPQVRPSIFAALPPGHVAPDVTTHEVPDFSNRPFRLFYVGGMSTHYQMHKLFEAVKLLPRIELTVCTRESEWQKVKDEYLGLTSNIKVVHLSGGEMEAKLKESDIAVLFVKPKEYREFASPVKLYEYLGFKKPILASEGTLAGRFVKEQRVGWTIPYEVDAVLTLLRSLIRQPELINPVYERLQCVAPQHSWEARAEKVIKDLQQ